MSIVKEEVCEQQSDKNINLNCLASSSKAKQRSDPKEVLEDDPVEE